jgi:hypothetical protein
MFSFPEKWVDGREQISWPTRSPDLRVLYLLSVGGVFCKVLSMLLVNNVYTTAKRKNIRS